MAKYDNCRIVKFDGIDGCGKTTLISSIHDLLKAAYRIKVLKEFGDNSDSAFVVGRETMSVSRLLRMIAKSESLYMDDIERELLWTIISRRLNRVVLPKYVEGSDLILVDRSNLGNIAYGVVFAEWLDVVFEKAVGEVEYFDLLFWIDTPVDVCWDRISQRSLDVIERKGLTFLGQVREIYRERSMSNPKIVRLDGTLDKVELAQAALVVMKERKMLR